MTASLHCETLDPWSLLLEYQQSKVRGMGATAVFVGTMRDYNEGNEVAAMTLEHYPGMTEKVLSDIETQIRDAWDVMDIRVAHRTGVVLSGDPIVLVAVWSAHRKEAFEACRALMEQLKSRVPFWKRETLKDGSHRWVEKNTAGYAC